MAIVRKEFSCFFSSAAYMLNSAIGIVLSVLIAVGILTSKGQIDELVAMLSAELGGIDLSGAVIAFFTAALTLVGGMNLISASALSLEGDRFWILRSMPISADVYLLAKAVPAFVVPLVPGVISSVVLAVALGADALHTVLMILVPIAANLFISILGILINALFPRFSFENVTQVVKQSLAVFIMMLAGTLYGFINVVLAVAIGLFLSSSALSLAAMIVLALILSLVCLAITCGPIKRKYENYSV